MAVEIERKFLVNPDKWENAEKPKGHFYRQGYLSADPERTVRARVTDTAGFITIKGISKGVTRTEFEYEIPMKDAQALIDDFAVLELTKVRYKIPVGGKNWDVDVYLGQNSGLIIAEIELNNEQEAFEKPDWIDKEVTGEEKYYNVRLARNNNKKL